MGTVFCPRPRRCQGNAAVVDKPLIQYAVEEAVAAGITDLIFVTGRNKRAIEDHFDSAPELESDLESKGKHELLAMVRGILPAHVNCLYIRQSARWAWDTPCCRPLRPWATNPSPCCWPTT